MMVLCSGSYSSRCGIYPVRFFKSVNPHDPYESSLTSQVVFHMVPGPDVMFI
jgi:hypothetical protein